MMQAQASASSKPLSSESLEKGEGTTAHETVGRAQQNVRGLGLRGHNSTCLHHCIVLLAHLYRNVSRASVIEGHLQKAPQRSSPIDILYSLQGHIQSRHQGLLQMPLNHDRYACCVSRIQTPSL